MTKNTPKNTPKNEPIRRAKKRIGLLKDRRLQLVLGFALFFMAFYLLLAFTSYLFTAKADQSVVEAIDSTGVIEAGDEVENWLGIYGALLSYRFIFRWMGLGAFFIVPLLVHTAVDLIFRVRLFAFKRTFLLFLFLAFWLSYTLGYLAVTLPGGNYFTLIAGGVGYELARWTHALIGWGTPLWLAFCFIVFAIYFWNITAVDWKQWRAFKRMAAHGMEAVSSKKHPVPPATPSLDTAEEESDEYEEDEEEKGEEVSRLLYEDEKKIEEEVEKMGMKLVRIGEEEEEQQHSEATKKASKPVAADTEEKEEAGEKEEASIITFLLEEEEKQSGKEKQPSKDAPLTVEVVNTTDLPPVSAVVDEDEEDEDEEDTLDNSTPGSLTTTYDPRLELSRYQMPPTSLLDDAPAESVQVTREELEANKDKIVETLGHYGIGIESIKATIGPTVTLYELVPKAGVRISKIKNLEDDIALSLSALGIRIIAPIPGKGTIGIEVPNKKRELVALRPILESEQFRNTKYALPIAFGKTVTNEIFMVDLAKMPHLLIAGATGQGKSVGLNVILASLLYKKHPAELKFVLVDPKKVELTLYNKIERHFLAKLPDEEEAIITDTSKVINTLNSLCIEMDTRYDLLKKAGCRNIKEYNKKFLERRLNPEKGHRFMPYIVLIIDELADLMMTAGKEVEQPIARLAQLARAIGIHLVVATQRPSVNVITGIIKANFPARLSFRVTSKVDSRTILDTGGAEQLIGMGDMLFSTGADLVRVQCAFIDTHEVEAVCDFIGEQPGYASAYLLPEYVGEAGENEAGAVDLSDRDALFEEAARIVVMHQQGSTSLLQRRLKIGYNRAGRIIDQLEQAGIVGPFEGSKAREVLIPDEYALEQLLNELNNKHG
ncbi:MAG: hypothetical protein KatS3mg033_1119 [Thermonema sp.]|uniref:FtsK/SpoIIIE family DNA translocase n=1 Tax=Thermonema sp. TaxID=2231181 RepID=UPI0021DE9B64|nr:DNA translocase FtsK [Thermonema sp.]GIV39319.1 MAG: hypothetical protein KatS3mg033_1119 [Thermonema sp.]